ncbi:MAG: HD domain-containing protein [Calditrichota bacterium]
MINREEALTLVQERLTQDNLVKHVLAVEMVMRGLAKRMDEDEELWGLTGLLHDLDYMQTEATPERHGSLTVIDLKDKLPPEALQAILVHAGHQPAQTNFDWALYCADPVTGLITAGVLMHPSHSLKDYSVKSLKKRFKDKRFAAGANREQMESCVNLGLSLDEFLALALQAMTEGAETLGL